MDRRVHLVAGNWQRRGQKGEEGEEGEQWGDWRMDALT